MIDTTKTEYLFAMAQHADKDVLAAEKALTTARVARDRAYEELEKHNMKLAETVYGAQD